MDQSSSFRSICSANQQKKKKYSHKEWKRVSAAAEMNLLNMIPSHSFFIHFVVSFSDLLPLLLLLFSFVIIKLIQRDHFGIQQQQNKTKNRKFIFCCCWRDNLDSFLFSLLFLKHNYFTSFQPHSDVQKRKRKRAFSCLQIATIFSILYSFILKMFDWMAVLYEFRPTKKLWLMKNKRAKWSFQFGPI